MAVSVAGSKAASLIWSLAVLTRRKPNLALEDKPWWKKKEKYLYTYCNCRFSGQDFPALSIKTENNQCEQHVFSQLQTTYVLARCGHTIKFNFQRETSTENKGVLIWFKKLGHWWDKAATEFYTRQVYITKWRWRILWHLVCFFQIVSVSFIHQQMIQTKIMNDKLKIGLVQETTTSRYHIQGFEVVASYAIFWGILIPAIVTQGIIRVSSNIV